MRDPAFVGSLLSDHGGFRLYLQHVIDDTHLGMSILGPGMRRDCRRCWTTSARTHASNQLRCSSNGAADPAHAVGAFEVVEMEPPA